MNDNDRPPSVEEFMAAMRRRSITLMRVADGLASRSPREVLTSQEADYIQKNKTDILTAIDRGFGGASAEAISGKSV